MLVHQCSIRTLYSRHLATPGGVGNTQSLHVMKTRVSVWLMNHENHGTSRGKAKGIGTNIHHPQMSTVNRPRRSLISRKLTAKIIACSRCYYSLAFSFLSTVFAPANVAGKTPRVSLPDFTLYERLQ